MTRGIQFQICSSSHILQPMFSHSGFNSFPCISDHPIVILYFLSLHKTASCQALYFELAYVLPCVGMSKLYWEVTFSKVSTGSKNCSNHFLKLKYLGLLYSSHHQPAKPWSYPSIRCLSITCFIFTQHSLAVLSNGQFWTIKGSCQLPFLFPPFQNW